MTERKERPFTKAAFATNLAAIARIAVSAQADLAMGMWNPNFCLSDATFTALSICEDLQEKLDQIRARCADGESASKEKQS